LLKMRSSIRVTRVESKRSLERGLSIAQVLELNHGEAEGDPHLRTQRIRFEEISKRSDLGRDGIFACL
jgi:hypothetical protein